MGNRGLMREYEHTYWRNREEGRVEILLADTKSAKAKYGHYCQEYLDEDSDHFLREGHTTFPDHATVYQLTEPSKGIGGPLFANAGEGFIVVEEQQRGGGFTECQIHKSKIIWDA